LFVSYALSLGKWTHDPTRDETLEIIVYDTRLLVWEKKLGKTVKFGNPGIPAGEPAAAGWDPPLRDSALDPFGWP